MTRTLLQTFVLPAGLLVALAACGSLPEAAPSSAPALPSAPASPSTPAAASSVPDSASAAASTPASAASAAASLSASGSGGAVKLILEPNSTEIDVQMRELLAGNAAQTDAVETTKTVSGAILMDGTNAVLTGSKLTMDLTTLQSDRQIRDNFIKRATLETNKFPTMDFVPKQVQGLNGPLPSSGQATFKLLGDATIKGVTKPISWDVTATFTQQAVQGQATASFKLSDFGMTPPKAGPVISVDDTGRLTVKFQATRAAA